MYADCGPQDNIIAAVRPVIRRKSSVALSSLQDRLRSGPRISPPLMIDTLSTPTVELAPPGPFSPVSPTSFGRLGLPFGPDFKDKTNVTPLSCYTNLSMRRGSGGSISSISSNGSSPVESSPASSFFNSSPLEQSSGGPRTPSYLGLSPRNGPQELKGDPMVDHLPSTEIASRAVSALHRRRSVSEQVPAKPETTYNQIDNQPPIEHQTLPQQVLAEPVSPTTRTRLSAAALAELELESKGTDQEGSQPYCDQNENHLSPRKQMASHLRTRLRPKSSGADSATSCGTVKAGNRFAKLKAGALRPFAMLRQQSQLSHFTDDADTERESDAGTDTPAMSPKGNAPQLRNPFELMNQRVGTPPLDLAMPSAPRLRPQHPFRGEGQDDENSASDSSSGESSDSEEDEGEARNMAGHSHPHQRSALRRSMPSALALPEGLTDLSLDVCSWRHGEVEMAWRESAKRREKRFHKRATICGVVQFEVDHDEADDDDDEVPALPATPSSIMRETAEASTQVLLEASASARTTPRPESWSPARFTDASMTSRQVRVFSSKASKDAVQSGSAATGERMTAALRGESVVPVLPPPRPTKNKLRAISSLHSPIPLDLKRLHDESEGPVPPGLRSSIEKARKAEQLAPSPAAESTRHQRHCSLPARHPISGGMFLMGGSSPSSPLPLGSSLPSSPSTPIPAGASGRRVSVSMPLFLPATGAALLGHGAGGAMLSPAIATAAINAAMHHGVGVGGSDCFGVYPSPFVALGPGSSKGSARRSSLAAMRRPHSPPLGTSPVEEPALNSLMAALASAAASDGQRQGAGWAATAGEMRRRSLVVTRSRAPSLADGHLNDHARHGFIVDATTTPAPGPSSSSLN
ncbi:unnamed protein product [Tilletia controversa]|nr:hypothetical protein CF328_g2069 [Tilletia controversa]CAD6900759.1 unnamed protein product [Tilletia controversa]CAD6919267.1 unnamed protein product [Tilletia controversa]CAD6963652.1 unnamed protein product [Tilletia controversa]CAD6973355.1 unnamed protein product [Tilletia controversa]